MSTLEVKCGPHKALLFMERMQGGRFPCILFNEKMITPIEFQTVSGLDYMKNWSQSIKHHGISLRSLTKNKKNTQYGGFIQSNDKVYSKEDPLLEEFPHQREVKKESNEEEYEEFLKFQRFLRPQENLAEQSDDQFHADYLRFQRSLKDTDNNKQAMMESVPQREHTPSKRTSQKRVNTATQIRNSGKKLKSRPPTRKMKDTFSWSKL